MFILRVKLILIVPKQIREITQKIRPNKRKVLTIFSVAIRLSFTRSTYCLSLAPPDETIHTSNVCPRLIRLKIKNVIVIKRLRENRFFTSFELSAFSLVF